MTIESADERAAERAQKAKQVEKLTGVFVLLALILGLTGASLLAALLVSAIRYLWNAGS